MIGGGRRGCLCAGSGRGGTTLFGGAVLMADGRVFFVPGQPGGGTAVIKPHIWDPYTDGCTWWRGMARRRRVTGRLPAAGWPGVLHAGVPGQRAGAHLRSCAGPRDSGGGAGSGRLHGLRGDGGRPGAAGAAHGDEPADLRPEGGHDDTFAGGDAGRAADGQDFYGGVLLGDGRVLLVPHMARGADGLQPGRRHGDGDRGGACGIRATPAGCCWRMAGCSW